MCTDLISLEKGLELQEKYPWIFNAAATSPHDVKKEGEKNFLTFKKYAQEKK